MALKDERERDLEPINRVLRNETIEEIVPSDGDGVIVSFRGSAPDLSIRPIGDDVDLELELAFLE